ncbi:ATP-dependent DNA helicase [Mycena indigotica]|uniref:ATP-dependent DNA helicase n=1 Tax=Mycena indigotica TaxID=2126181 RepID=A0A8H6T6Q9_9AGAR|nr:ATP-dependent DNA helicase [Mycena indigotica]KAF7311961.1 ATP-dependent DNA helicase [Mycena indigotica]
MNWGDRYISHQFVKIYWDEVTWAIRTAYPGIAMARMTAEDVHHEMTEGDEITEPPARVRYVDGKLEIKDQMKEYADRGTELDEMNLYDYFTLTYHTKDGIDNEEDDAPDDGDEDVHPQPKRRGRRRNRRVAYLERSERKGCRVFRGNNMETVLHFIGKWFPSRKDGNSAYYAAQVLALLKPWRTLRDLQSIWPTMEAALQSFLIGACDETHRIIENIEYFHQCSDSARARRDQESTQPGSGGYYRAEGDGSEGMSGANPEEEIAFTEEDVERARAARYAAREVVYGQRALLIARERGIFRELPTDTGERMGVAQATRRETEMFEQWGREVAAMTRQNRGQVERPLELNPDIGDFLERRCQLRKRWRRSCPH